MIRLVQRFIGVAACLITAGFITGCATTPQPTTQPTRTVMVIPGVFGDGPWYDGLRDAAATDTTAVKTITWGMPKPLFAINFSNHGVHEDAEKKIAAAIDATTGPLDLVGHSAGCGVILGALAKAHRDVGHVVLIAPSVSPGYDLSPALARLKTIDVFYSDRDTTFLKWRCSTFGTYDGVKTPAAGFVSFNTTNDKLTQHAYDPTWQSLGNDGGHGGGTAAAFDRTVIRPILNP